jgi:hypothetical protein
MAVAAGIMTALVLASVQNKIKRRHVVLQLFIQFQELIMMQLVALILIG